MFIRLQGLDIPARLLRHLLLFLEWLLKDFGLRVVLYNPEVIDLLRFLDLVGLDGVLHCHVACSPFIGEPGVVLWFVVPVLVITMEFFI